MGMFKRIRITAAAILQAVVLTACASSGRAEEIASISQKYDVPVEDQLIVYTSHKEEVYLPIITEFENRTGIMVDVHAGGTAEMMQAAAEASLQGECDIMFGGGIESYEAQKDLFLAYESREIKSLDETYVSKDRKWTSFTELPIVFIYNQKLLPHEDAPKTWGSLLNPKWKGQIAYADLGSSGTSYTIIASLEQILGESYKTLVPKLYEQLDGKLLSSSGQIIPKVSDGTYLIGITLEETAKKYMEQGYDISMIYPLDGTTAVPDGIAMLRNAPHSYNAGRFIDFVVGYDTQRYAMDTFYRRPIRRDIPLTSGYGSVTLRDFDVIRSAEEETDIFRIWNELEQNKGGE